VLEVEVRKRLDRFSLEAGLSVAASSVLVLVGESGSGKTTLLRLIAGLLEPDHGRIALAGAVWSDSAGGVRIPPRLRSVGYVAQDYALFPHLSAAQNVGFGLRALGRPGREASQRVAGWMDRLGIRDLAARRPGQLSGGQQQRVALARALVLEPDVLLLDEPLAALDLPARRGVRQELRTLLDALPCVTLLVTHSPQEALAFGGRIAVLEAGRVTQEGSRDELLRKPRTRYIAEFLGTNLVRAVARAAEGGLTRLACADGEIVAAESALDGEVFAVIDPREIMLSRDPPAGSARNVLRGRVEEVQPEPPAGDRVRVTLASRPALVAELTRDAAEGLGIRVGDELVASFKATGVRVFR
jgi:molybdate transport system ATP-binding protein